VREVADLAVGAGKRLGLSGGELTVLARAAELHDIGKMAVPDTILNKPGPLDDDERAFMRRHAIVGEQILAAAPAMSEVALVVRASHERLDGGGYPDGLSGNQIPLGARIVAVCDAYDALTSERPYRAPVSATDALAELRRCAGTQFDPAVVEAFVAVLAERSAARPPAREALLLAGAVGRHAAAG
jgi:HD-GYP domain-containing protein (c-di-GMP phosphodiesterase class II)